MIWDDLGGLKCDFCVDLTLEKTIYRSDLNTQFWRLTCSRHLQGNVYWFMSLHLLLVGSEPIARCETNFPSFPVDRVMKTAKDWASDDRFRGFFWGKPLDH